MKPSERILQFCRVPGFYWALRVWRLTICFAVIRDLRPPCAHLSVTWGIGGWRSLPDRLQSAGGGV